MEATTAMLITIEDWSVVSATRDGYTPPELGRPCLRGKVKGHPSHRDGKGVVTSMVVKAEGRTVTTKSGSVYRLGAVSKEYRAWLKANGMPYNPRKPVTVGA